MKIIVLMSTYNGEHFLKAQIDSLLAQDVADFAQLKLLVRDDGSRDSTTAILKQYQDENKLTWYSGANLGPEKSFMDLLNRAPDADYYAFCDQDDVWFPDKLSRAVHALAKVDNQAQPLLYCTAVTATDAELKPFDTGKSPLMRYTDYAHALVYSTTQGCTFVFNHIARSLVLRYDMNTNYVLMHDWLTHKVVTIMGGTMIYDKKPSLYYRQHGSNVIGASTTGTKDFILRVRRFLTGSGRQTRSDAARSLLQVYGDSVSPEVYSALDLVANYRGCFPKKMQFMGDKRFATGTVNDLFLKILILLETV